MSKHRVTPETHRLTDLPGEKHPHVCQRCGSRELKKLSRWIEHDHNDQVEYKWLVLCERCGDEVIAQHPRLYKQVQRFEPLPGCMTVCIDCRHRDGVLCKCPMAQINGGPGMEYDTKPYAFAFVDGPRFRGRVAMYEKPVSKCTGKEPVAV